MSTIESAERQRILELYTANSRALADTVQHLRDVQAETEAFIKALVSVGAAHRACEHSRIALDRHMKSMTTPGQL